MSSSPQQTWWCVVPLKILPLRRKSPVPPAVRRPTTGDPGLRRRLPADLVDSTLAVLVPPETATAVRGPTWRWSSNSGVRSLWHPRCFDSQPLRTCFALLELRDQLCSFLVDGGQPLLSPGHKLLALAELLQRRIPGASSPRGVGMAHKCGSSFELRHALSCRMLGRLWTGSV